MPAPSAGGRGFGEPANRGIVVVAQGPSAAASFYFRGAAEFGRRIRHRASGHESAPSDAGGRGFLRRAGSAHGSAQIAGRTGVARQCDSFTAIISALARPALGAEVDDYF